MVHVPLILLVPAIKAQQLQVSTDNANGWVEGRTAALTSAAACFHP